MRKWHKKRTWRMPVKGDLAYLIGSFGQRCGPVSIVVSVGPGAQARVFCTEHGFASSHDWNDVEVVSEGR